MKYQNIPKKLLHERQIHIKLISKKPNWYGSEPTFCNYLYDTSRINKTELQLTTDQQVPGSHEVWIVVELTPSVLARQDHPAPGAI